MVVVEKAPAKINLYLGVHKQIDARGYHRVDSLMVALDLADEVIVEEADALQVTCVPEVDVPQQQNTAYKAALLFGRAHGREPRVAISIKKRIPEQSGMGGSSSDAAAVLRALCKLWGVDERNPSVMKVARAVGADVPFFLNPVPTLLTGAGDVPSETFPSLSGWPIVLVRPKGLGISTAIAYKEFDRVGKEPQGYKNICAALRSRNRTVTAVNISNNLEPVACLLKPSIAEVKQWLSQQEEAKASQVTGSGSCVFALCEDEGSAHQLVNKALAHTEWWTCETSIYG